MTAIELEERVSAVVAEADTDGVLRWRYEELRRAGYPPVDAARLARTGRVDLHVAVDLLRHGCAAPTALRILL